MALRRRDPDRQLRPADVDAQQEPLAGHGGLRLIPHLVRVS
jgi:hypothetical protein